jgi:hypothetical protein
LPGEDRYKVIFILFLFEWFYRATVDLATQFFTFSYEIENFLYLPAPPVYGDGIKRHRQEIALYPLCSELHVSSPPHLSITVFFMQTNYG